jgi:predicted alpha/beta hydrolase
MTTTPAVGSEGTPAAGPVDAPVQRPRSEFSSLEAIIVPVSDRVAVTVRVLAQADPSAPVVLLLPAMALKAKFYLPLAKALSGAGLSVATCDLRGQGESTPGLHDGPGFGYLELLEVDPPAVVAAVRRRFPSAPLYLFGHSLGGQVALFHAAGAPAGIAGVLTIGTGTPFWWAFGPRHWLEALWKIQTIGMVARRRGYWPGGMLIGGEMAGRVMIDWSRQSLTSWCRPKGSKRHHDKELRALALPVLAISLDADSLGPRSNVDFLCRRMPAAQVTRWHVKASSGVAHRDHFEWIKDSAVIGPVAAHWIRTGELPADEGRAGTTGVLADATEGRRA